MSESHYDVIVIGAGGMGAATLYHLAHRGWKVLGLEQFGVAHDRGSSHGQSRIIRRAYFEHPDYVPLLNRAYALWRELEAEAGRELMRLCGLLLAGRPDDPIVAGTRRAAALHGLALDDLGAAGAQRRFPQFRLDEDMDALFEQDGGFLRVEECVRAHLARAEELGAALRMNEAVLDWRSDGKTVSVTTAAGVYHAAALVIAAGAWSGQVLRELGLPLSVERVAFGWFPTEDHAFRLESGAPVFAMQTPGGFFYGFPRLDARGVKVAKHAGGEAVPDPANVNRAFAPGDLEDIRAFNRSYAPALADQHSAHAVCMYTMTPDGHFIVDRHPRDENVAYACGFSGHGYKFAPIMGSVLADLATEGRTEEPIGFLSAARFGRA